MKGNSNSKRVCGCNLLSCKLAGYFPNQEPICIPKGKPEMIKMILNQTGFVSSETRASVTNGGKLRVYPWHFFPHHLQKNESGKYELNLDLDKYYDSEGNTYKYPPPRGEVKDFINKELLADDYVSPQKRWALDNKKTKMPQWMQNIIDIDSTMSISLPTTITPAKSKTHRSSEKWEARARLLEQQMKEQAEKHARAMEQMKRKYEEISKVCKDQKEIISQLEKKSNTLEEQLKEKQQLIEDMHQ